MTLLPPSVLSIRRRAAHGAAVALACTLLAGCGGPRLAPDPAAATDLQGVWLLDPAASDDAHALIAAALPPPPRHVRRPPPPTDDVGLPGDPGRGGPGGGDGRFPGRGRGQDGGRGGEGGRGTSSSGTRDDSGTPAEAPPPRAVGALAEALALPPHVLRITQGARTLTIDQDGRRRAFAPGDDTPYSVTDRFGTRSLRAGWERSEFVVVGRSGNSLELVERFRRGAAPDTVIAVTTLKAPGLHDLRISSTYRRATGEPPPPSAAEGPPAPVR